MELAQGSMGLIYGYEPACSQLPRTVMGVLHGKPPDTIIISVEQNIYYTAVLMKEISSQKQTKKLVQLVDEKNLVFFNASLGGEFFYPWIGSAVRTLVCF